jgi:hypothetical protein
MPSRREQVTRSKERARLDDSAAALWEIALLLAELLDSQESQ